MKLMVIFSLSFSILQKEDAMLKIEVDHAEIIVAGKVERIYPLYENTEKIVTEYEADWHVAEIKISSVLKGKDLRATRSATQNGIIRTYFPNSLGGWNVYPKFKRGQKGIFLFHLEKHEQPTKYGTDVFVGLVASNFQPQKNLKKIRNLLKH